MGYNAVGKEGYKKAQDIQSSIGFNLMLSFKKLSKIGISLLMVVASSAVLLDISCRRRSMYSGRWQSSRKAKSRFCCSLPQLMVRQCLKWVEGFRG